VTILRRRWAKKGRKTALKIPLKAWTKTSDVGMGMFTSRLIGSFLLLVVFGLAAAGGGIVYLKFKGNAFGLRIETKGEVRYRTAKHPDWGVAPARLTAREGDRFHVGPGAYLHAGGEELGVGAYEVIRADDGEIALVSSTKGGDGPQRTVAQGDAVLISGEAELAVLRSELEGHLQPLSLAPVKDWLPVGEGGYEFQDFQVSLLEPPSGRRLGAGSEIWLHWTPVPFDDVKYSVEIARSMQFVGIRPRPARTNRVTVRLDESGFYFWRVRAIRRGRTVLSKPSSFEVR
jgi:hypothetical protein